MFNVEVDKEKSQTPQRFIFMKLYKTKDIYLASTLLAMEFPIEKTERENDRIFFFFRTEREPLIAGDTFTIDKAIKAYWDRSIEIAPLQLFGSFKELKNRIYSQ